MRQEGNKPQTHGTVGASSSGRTLAEDSCGLNSGLSQITSLPFKRPALASSIQLIRITSTEMGSVSGKAQSETLDKIVVLQSSKKI